MTQPCSRAKPAVLRKEKTPTKGQSAREGIVPIFRTDNKFGAKSAPRDKRTSEPKEKKTRFAKVGAGITRGRKKPGEEPECVAGGLW
jgi:hypothetical protein